ncbi:MAG: hypothetical protein AAFY76_16805, partial [Cyanobacteria bacterium J06649_11]
MFGTDAVLKVIKQQTTHNFRNQPVTAYLTDSKIKLEITPSMCPETFLEMYKKRQPIALQTIENSLSHNGFPLANLGICIALELEMPNGRRFAVFTRRGEQQNCLALISGYWDISSDPTPDDCARRELLEEFLIFDKSQEKFLTPQGFDFPYKECPNNTSTTWTLKPTSNSVSWVPSAQLQTLGITKSHIYIDPSTSSAQVVYGYYAKFSALENLSICHAEDQPDEHGNMVTSIRNGAIILLEITNQHLSHNTYALEDGKLTLVNLPNDTNHRGMKVGII